MANRIGNIIYNVYDRFTGGSFNMFIVEKWWDGTLMDESKVNNVIYFKVPASLGGGFALRVIEGPMQVAWWGAKGDYNPINKTGTDDTDTLYKCSVDVSALGGGVLEFKGQYLLSKKRIGLGQMNFKNISKLKIIANDAVFYTKDFDSFLAVNLSFAINGSLAIATAVSASAHGYKVGDPIVVKGALDKAYTGVYTILSVVNQNTFSYTLTSTPQGSANGLVNIISIERMFIQLDNCHNVEIPLIQFIGIEQPKSIQYRCGWVGIRTSNGCSNITANIVAKGLAYGLQSGDYNLDTGNMTNSRIFINAENVGYPIALYKSGDNSYFNIIANRVHRGGYFTGTSNAAIDVKVKNYDVAGVLIGLQKIGDTLISSKNVIINAIDSGSDEEIDFGHATEPRYLVILSGYNVPYPGELSNIDIHISAINALYVVGVQAIIHNPLIKYSNITISGLLDRSKQDPSIVYSEIDLGVSPTTFPGQWSNIKIKDLKVINPDGLLRFPKFLFSNLTDDLIFDNYNTNSPRIDYRVLTNKKITQPTYAKSRLFKTSEQAVLQCSNSGVYLNNNKAVISLYSQIGISDFTLNWCGDCQNEGDYSLFTISTITTSIQPNSLSLRVVGGNLEAVIYGNDLNSFVGIRYLGFQNEFINSVAVVSFIRINDVLKLYVNGYNVLCNEFSSGSQVLKTAPINGVNVILGADGTLKYTGTINKFFAINTDLSDNFPKEIFRLGGLSKTAITNNTYIISDTVMNGGFETPGVAPNLYANWTAEGSGESKVENDTVEFYTGSNSAKITVDALNSLVVLRVRVFEVGKQYQLSFAAKRRTPATTVVEVTGFNDPTFINLTDNWTVYSISGTAKDLSLDIKRGAPNVQFNIDSIKLKQSGYLCAFDFQSSYQDLNTGNRVVLDLTTLPNKIFDNTSVKNQGDVSITLYPRIDAYKHIFGTALTASRTVTLSALGARNGEVFKIIRTVPGVNTLTVNGVIVGYGRYIEFTYNGTSWIVTQTGSNIPAVVANAATDTPTKVQLNTAYPNAPQGFSVDYPNLTTGAGYYRKLSDVSTGDWAFTSFTFAN